MSPKIFKTIFLNSLLILVSINFGFSRSVGQFCDNNFVDAVLWDGISYRLTRNEWIALYYENNRTVGPFVHKSDDFKNEKGYYYQSVYHIPNVPICTQTTVSCQMIKQLEGLTVVAIRRYYSEKETFDVIQRTNRNGSLIHINIQNFIESNFVSKGSAQKYRPSVYSPKDFTFIHITNQYRNFGPLLETIELKTNGVIERTYHELNQFKDIVFITSFWWSFDQNVYVIGEHKSGFGKPFIYELDIKNRNRLLKPINKSVLEFFGCNQTTDNRLQKRIQIRISDEELANWSVHTVPITTSPTEFAKSIYINNHKREHNNQTRDQTPFSTTIDFSTTTDSIQLIDPINQRSDEKLYKRNRNNDRNDKIKTEIKDRIYHRMTDTLKTTTLSVPYQMTDRRNSRMTAKQSNKTKYDIRVTKDYRMAYQKIDKSRPQTIYQSNNPIIDKNTEQTIDSSPKSTQQISEQTFNPLNDHQNSGLFSIKPNKDSDKTDKSDKTQNNSEFKRRIKISKEIPKFWKIFPIIIMISMFLIAICILIFGFFAVFNLRNLLSTNVRHKKLKQFNGLKKQRLKYDDELSDFFIEEYDSSPKHFSAQSVDSSSCQTNESFETKTKL